jgi:three-Cys-motif partner protein
MRNYEMPVKVPTSDWLKGKISKLVEMVDIVKKESPEIFSIADPDYGFWSLKKEIALMFWTYTFQQIAHKWFDSYYYIDLFAGSGLMKAENSFFVGSPIVAVSSTVKDKEFSKYICIEENESRAKALDNRMKAICLHYGTCKAEVYQADSNAELENILKENSPKGKTCFLAFVDPQGITDLKWKTLETLLKHGKGDIILNFPTMSVNRNLTIPECRPVLTEFLGNNKRIGKTVDEVFNGYKSRISQYRKDVDSLEVIDEHNHRLYDLVFTTSSLGMKNALDDMKERLNEIKTRDIHGLYEVVAEGQKQLLDF